MKIVVEYGNNHDLITVNGVESISQLPFGLLVTISDTESYTIDTVKLYSLEVIPDA